MNKKWISVLQIAATYIGTVVGAGFATGKEIYEFFTRFGFLGLIGIVFSGLLFSLIGTKIMIISHRIKASSYQEFNNYLFGNKFGQLINVLTMIILYGITSVMLSGTGAIFKEQLGVPYFIGIILTLIITFIIMAGGLNGVLGINSLVVPMMLIFSFILWITIDFPSTKPTQHLYEWTAYLNPLLYVAFNLAMAQAVLVPLGKEMDEENTIKWGGILGGLGLTIMLISYHIALASLTNVNSYDIPMAEIIQKFGMLIHLLFLFVIYGEILTTLVGNVFGLTRQIQSIIHMPEKLIVLLILALSFIISLIGFGTLLSFLYPLFGYVGLLLLVTVLFFKLSTAK